jgi:cyclic-di-GMP-binding biofilm dispersal mediator protein
MEIVIFGATGGIGRALAQALQGRGRLWLTGRNEAALFELAETLGAEAEAMDLSDETAVQAFLAEIGPVDRLFYAAGAVFPPPRADRSRGVGADVHGQPVGRFPRLETRPMGSGRAGSVPRRLPPADRPSGPGGLCGLKVGPGGLAHSRASGTAWGAPDAGPPASGGHWHLGAFRRSPKGAMDPEEAARRILEAVEAEAPPDILEL